MEVDAALFAQKCQACQLNNKIHASVVELHSLSTRWLFRTCAFDLIGPINIVSRSCMHLTYNCMLHKVGGDNNFEGASAAIEANFILTTLFVGCHS